MSPPRRPRRPRAPRASERPGHGEPVRRAGDGFAAAVDRGGPLPRRDAARAWQAVTSDIERTEQSLSRWRADSALSRLNATAGSGASAPTDRRLLAFLAASRRAQRMSDGRFDPRVIRRLEALGERAGVPASRRRQRRLAATDRGWIAIRAAASPASPPRSIPAGSARGSRCGGRSRRSRTGPHAHGPAARGRRRSRRLRGAGRRRPWQVGVEDPAGGDEPLAVISRSRRGAIATSSTAVRRWTSPDGDPVHHLIDPSTGAPGGHGLRAVTVSAPDPAWAEVWSKALFLAGRRAIGGEARRRGLAAWWVEDDGSLHMTPTARQQTAWTSADRAA